MQKGFWAAAICLSLCACNGSSSNSTTAYEAAEFELLADSSTHFFTLSNIAPEQAVSADEIKLYYANSIPVYFDLSGYVRTHQGYYVLNFPVNSDGSVASVSLASSKALQIDFSRAAPPRATTSIIETYNLPADSHSVEQPFLEQSECGYDPDGYNAAASISIYDSLRETHVLTSQFALLSSDTNTWQVRLTAGCMMLTPNHEEILDFNELGKLDVDDADGDGIVTSAHGVFFYEDILLGNGSDTLTFTVDFSDSTSLPQPFSVNELEQDGYASNRNDSMSILSNGLVHTTTFYGDKIYVGKLLMARFPSPFYLKQDSDGIWLPTEDSGDPSHGEFGTVQPVTYHY